jgi:hypothetical protein
MAARERENEPEGIQAEQIEPRRMGYLSRARQFAMLVGRIV